MKRYLSFFCIVLTVSDMCSQSSWASFVLNNTVCVGSSVNVAAITGTNTVIGYTWTALPSNSVISSPNNSVTAVTFTPAGTYTIILVADDGSTTASDTNMITVGPNLTSSGPLSTICPPPTSQGPVNLYAYGASTYTWMPSASTGSVLNLSPYPSSSTTYTVTGTDSNGCTTFTTQYVQVYPQIPIYVSAPTIVCDGSMVCFTESGGGLNFWVWDDGCGNSVSGGPYACFTASLGCGNTYSVGGNNMTCMNYMSFTVNISPCTVIGKIEAGSNVYELFPNPVSDKLNVKTNTTINSNDQLEFTDVSGRIISRSKCAFNTEYIHNIDVSEFSPGIYFARIISGEQISKPVKIVKE
jgi:hypothetical protein